MEEQLNYINEINYYKQKADSAYNLYLKEHKSKIKVSEELSKTKKILNDRPNTRDQLYQEISSLNSKINNLQKDIGRRDEMMVDLKNEISDLTKKLQDANEKIKILQDDINSNTKATSENSSLPPSKDIFKKPKNNRKSTGRKPGKAFGEPGYTLQKFENPDVIEVVHGTKKCSCGCDCSVIEVKKKQKVDVKVVTTVTEYQVEVTKCNGCKKIHKPAILNELVNPVTYGDGVKSFTLLLNLYGTIPLQRTSEIISDLTDKKVNLAESTICNILQDFTKKAQADLNYIGQEIKKCNVIHDDDTSYKVGTKQCAVNVVCADKYVLLTALKTKSLKNKSTVGVLNGLKGKFIVHDAASVYNKLVEDTNTHVFCNAHISRECKGIYEVEGENTWGHKMQLLMYEMHDAVVSAKENSLTCLPENTIKDFEKRFLDILKEGDEEYNDVEKTEYNKKGINVASRLRKNMDGHILFIKNFDIPYSNNFAERNLRPLKNHLKISGCSRSFEGLEALCCGRSIIQTTRLLNMSVLSVLSTIISGKSAFAQEETTAS